MIYLTVDEFDWDPMSTARFPELTWVIRTGNFTTGTTTPDWWDRQPCWMTRTTTWIVKPDKAWRWFDRFRTHPKPPAPVAGPVLALHPRKRQNRRSMAQITQAKRRNFVQTLRKQPCTS